MSLNLRTARTELKGPPMVRFAALAIEAGCLLTVCYVIATLFAA